MDQARRILELFGRFIFTVLIALGVSLIALSVVLLEPYSTFIMTVGSSFLTIGLTVPIALYFQTRSNSEAFKILNTCNQVGIESIFVSRKHDATDLRHAISDAVVNSDSMSLMGIAFRSFFDPSGESQARVTEKINSYSTRIRVLLLEPTSDAAKTRASIEEGNATISDINHTLENSLVSIATDRLIQVCQMSETQGTNHMRDPPDELRRWIENVNLEVRTYDSEPVVFLMIFNNAMFVEQYHRGRPHGLVSTGSCIGKGMPVIQYKTGSTGFRFLASHFEQLWSSSEDRTDRLMAEANSRYKKYQERLAAQTEGAP